MSWKDTFKTFLSDESSGKKQEVAQTPPKSQIIDEILKKQEATELRQKQEIAAAKTREEAQTKEKSEKLSQDVTAFRKDLKPETRERMQLHPTADENKPAPHIPKVTKPSGGGSNTGGSTPAAPATAEVKVGAPVPAPKPEETKPINWEQKVGQPQSRPTISEPPPKLWVEKEALRPPAAKPEDPENREVMLRTPLHTQRAEDLQMQKQHLDNVRKSNIPSANAQDSQPIPQNKPTVGKHTAKINDERKAVQPQSTPKQPRPPSSQPPTRPPTPGGRKK